MGLSRRLEIIKKDEAWRAKHLNDEEHRSAQAGIHTEVQKKADREMKKEITLKEQQSLEGQSSEQKG